MKTKKFFLPAIFLAVTIIAYIAASIVFCYTTKPAVTSGEFPFSVTYAYKGDTKTLSGICKFDFSGSHTILNEHRRYWSEEVIYDNPDNATDVHIVDENEQLQTTLSVHENIHAGYFMGDPMYKDYYLQDGLDAPAPHIDFSDHANEIYTWNETDPAVLESWGIKIIDYSYPKPIENSFSFSGIRYDADNIGIFVAILFLFFLACLIFVRKDKAYTYTALDKVGIAFNFLIGIFAVPFITMICFFFGITGSGFDLVDQLVYNMPSFAILCLALSIVFRRKGFGKTGFFIQFAGILPFVLLIVCDLI